MINNIKLDFFNRINFWRKQNNREPINYSLLEKLSYKSMEQLLRWQYKDFIQGDLK